MLVSWDYYSQILPIYVGTKKTTLTCIKDIWEWFPSLTMIPVRLQWGRYNLPRYITGKKNTNRSKPPTRYAWGTHMNKWSNVAVHFGMAPDFQTNLQCLSKLYHVWSNFGAANGQVVASVHPQDHASVPGKGWVLSQNGSTLQNLENWKVLSPDFANMPSINGVFSLAFPTPKPLENYSSANCVPCTTIHRPSRSAESHRASITTNLSGAECWLHPIPIDAPAPGWPPPLFCESTLELAACQSGPKCSLP